VEINRVPLGLWQLRSGVGDVARLSAMFSGVASTRYFQIDPGRLQIDARILRAQRALVSVTQASVGLAIDTWWDADVVGVAFDPAGSGRVQVYGRGLGKDTMALGIGTTEMNLLLPSAYRVATCHSTLTDVNAASEQLGLPEIPRAPRGLRIQKVGRARCAALRKFVDEMTGDSGAIEKLLAENPRELNERIARGLAVFLADLDTITRPIAIAAARRRAVRRITDAVSANSRRAYTLADLCGIACVSPRTLEYAFYDNFRLSPLAYVRALRLQGARHALLHRNDGAGVSEVALEYGFTHLGKFSVDYRRMFGERPSETLRHTVGLHASSADAMRAAA